MNTTEAPKTKDKPPPKNILVPEKKPKLTKAERRALQEKQRAAKGQAKDGKQAAALKQKQKQTQNQIPQQQQQQLSSNKENSKNNGTVNVNDGGKVLGMFSHLPNYKRTELLSGKVSLGPMKNKKKQRFHPAVLQLGYQYANGTVRGANSRCRAMMDVLKKVVMDYELKKKQERVFNVVQLSQELDQEIKLIFQYWTSDCRGHSVSMGNAMTFQKIIVANLSHNRELTSMDEAKKLLCEQMDAYVNERITLAGEAICQHAILKIQDKGEVLLVHGHSEAVINVILQASKLGKVFRVIVVDSRPLMEGQSALHKLREAGIECTYILLNSLSYLMKEVTKVFLGAAALMSNGSVLSRVGTAGIALVSQSYNVPVLVCCETYKISARLQLESITYNELGDPNDVIDFGDSGTIKNLTSLNLLYDLTPSEFVTGIITEMGLLPPSSVAVLLREMNPQDTAKYN